MEAPILIIGRRDLLFNLELPFERAFNILDTIEGKVIFPFNVGVLSPVIWGHFNIVRHIPSPAALNAFFRYYSAILPFHPVSRFQRNALDEHISSYISVEFLTSSIASCSLLN